VALLLLKQRGIRKTMAVGTTTGQATVGSATTKGTRNCGGTNQAVATQLAGGGIKAQLTMVVVEPKEAAL